MVKRVVVVKKVSAPKVSGRSKTKTKQVTKAPKPRLDANGAAYARLVSDPCAAPLVHPVYPGGDAGFLFRADSVLTFGGGATETSGYMHWTPGYVNASNTDLIVSAGASSSTTLLAGTNGTGPGKAFLAANAFGARCVAACVKVSYPGTESGRSGRIHYGHTTAGTIDLADMVSVDGIAPLVQHYTRTPPEIIEVIWRPNIADTELNDPTMAAGAVIRDRKSAITIAWAGLPVATGLTFHYTAIYEWTPRPTIGVSSNVSGKNPSANTMDEVLDALTRAGFAWVRNAAGAAGGGMLTGLINQMTNSFGLMPAVPRGRRGLSFQ